MVMTKIPELIQKLAIIDSIQTTLKMKTTIEVAIILLSPQMKRPRVVEIKRMICQNSRNH